MESPAAEGRTSAASFAPPSTPAVFRDLLIFEERLKQNAARLKARKQKYQMFLSVLCGVILLMGYYVVFETSRVAVLTQHWLLRYVRIGLLWVSCTMVFLFFASGIYADRITAANKYVRRLTRFVPQANRSLRTFNMYLNMRTSTIQSPWFAWLPFGRAPRKEALSGGPLAKPRASLGSARFVLPSTPRIFQRRGAGQPMAPTRNERGEIVFSSRVDAQFREGYERYRNAFERKRKEKLQAQRTSRAYWLSFLWTSVPPKPRPAPPRPGAASSAPPEAS